MIEAAQLAADYSRLMPNGLLHSIE